MADYEVVVDPDTGVWDAFVDRSGHFLQLSGWGRLKSTFGWQTERILVTRDGIPALGAQVLYRRLLFGPLAYVPRGPVGDDENAWPLLVSALREAAMRRRASFIKIEPDDRWVNPAIESGFVVSPVDIQPKTTMLLDLEPEMDEIVSWQNDNTRRNIRAAAKKGVTIREGGIDDIEAFYTLSQQTATRDGFGIHSIAYYEAALRELGDRARLFFAEADGSPIGGIFVAVAGGEAVYVYGASSNESRNRNPNQALQWHAIQWARARGCHSYDFWGVPDELGNDPNADGTGGLWGVYRFKRGFGGDIVAHPGALDLPLAPSRYRLWKTAFSIVKRVRRGGGAAT